MSNRKKSATAIADQINQALKPKDLYEEETECNAEIEDFDEGLDVGVKNQKLSDFRRRNAPQLHEVDRKYSGEVAKRKDFENDDLSESDDEDADEFEQSESEGGSSEASENDAESDEDNEDEQESSDDDEDDDEDFSFDISQADFSGPNEKSKSSLKIMDSKQIDEEIAKGQAVQNQQKIWEKLLEVRIKAQKMLTTANSLPDYDAHIELLEVDNDGEFSDKIDKAADNIHHLLDNLLDLQSTLVKNFSETKELNLKRKSKSKQSNFIMKRSKLAEYADLIDENFDAHSNFHTKTLQKWHERTKSVKEMKGSLGNVDIMTKIQNAMLKKDDIIRKTQLYRGGYHLFGNEDVKKDEEFYSPEIFDDSEFYHQQLRELIEYKSGLDENQAEIAQKLIELQKVRGKMKKRVDTRASKGRKIRYIVHNKLVNFMAPRDGSTMSDEARTELYNSLFGAANEGEML